MKEELKKNEGITLIALVITIIVLLILAGVTLSTLFGNNGILTESKLAVEANKEANAKEQVQLAWAACETEYQAAWTQDSSVVKKDYFDPDDLNRNLGTGTVKSVGYVENGKSTVAYTLDGTEYEFEIANGQVYKVGQAPDVTEPEEKPNGPGSAEGSSAEWEFDSSTGTILSIKLNDSGVYAFNTSTIIIPSTIDGVKVKKIERLYKDDLEGSFGIDNGGEYLKKVIISDGIEEIGNDAFCNCEAEEIIIPESVTKIDRWAFESCKNLSHITIPGSVKRLENTFIKCQNLSSVELSEGIEELGCGVFEGCDSLKELNIPSTVNKIDKQVFSGGYAGWSDDCCPLENISVSSSNKTFDDRGGNNVLVETSTNKVILGAKNSVLTEGITSIAENAFYGIELNGDFKFPNTLRTIEIDAFCYTRGLTDIVLPESLETIEEYAFEGCKNLETVWIPSSVTSIGSSAFAMYNYANPNGVKALNISSGSPLSQSSPDYPWGVDESRIHFNK